MSTSIQQRLTVERVAPFKVSGWKIVRKNRFGLLLAAALMIWAEVPATCSAGQIEITAFNLVDTVPGQDLWRFSYALSGFNFQAGEGFSVFFDYHNFTDLHNPTPNPSAVWDTIVVQPDLLLHADGYFDALALVNSPSTAGTYSVDFTWLGAEPVPPFSQGFYTYDANFSPVFQGQTVPSGTVAPEPGVWVLSLMGSGVLLLGAMRNANKKII